MRKLYLVNELNNNKSNNNLFVEITKKLQLLKTISTQFHLSFVKN